MLATRKPLLRRTAADLMTRDVRALTQETPLREATRFLLENQISGAPVVDSRGRCVGVLSTTDFVGLAATPEQPADSAAAPGPVVCCFQVKYRRRDGSETILCMLPSGVCALQAHQAGADGKEMVICRHPRGGMTDRHLVDVDQLPNEEVRRYMTADPVTVPADTPVPSLARRMIDAHLHRVIVVDEERRPVGVVSSTDVLAAVACTDLDERPRPEGSGQRLWDWPSYSSADDLNDGGFHE